MNLCMCCEADIARQGKLKCHDGLEVNAMAAKGVSSCLCMHRVIIFILINLFPRTENKVEKASELNHPQA